MRARKAAAFYAIFMGVSMTGIWLLFLLTGEVPEIHSRPVEIGLHLVAEIITAIALIMGGLGMLLRRHWGFKAYLLSMGMLLYTLIMSPGYFAQRGELAFVGMFAAFTFIALIFIVLALLNKDCF